MYRRESLLFDLDGTLVDSAVTIAQALTELSLARGGAPADVTQIRKLVSQGAPVLVRETMGPFAREGDADVAAFREILAGIQAQPDIVFPGVPDALAVLSTNGHACAVVTNKPEKLATQLLDQLRLSHFFGAVVGGDTLPLCKPDPAPLRHAIQALPGSSANTAIMIGDSHVDARAAEAAGLRFALFLGGYEPDSCHEQAVALTFASFADLPSALRRVAVGARTSQAVSTG